MSPSLDEADLYILMNNLQFVGTAGLYNWKQIAQPMWVGKGGGEGVKFSSMAFSCNLKRLVLCEGKLCIICARYVTVILTNTVKTR